jgi:dimethylhistidine N-methyltransferase
VAEFAADVRLHLARQPPQLPSRYFYDALGSALFEAICRLPWYHVARAESGLLDRHGPAILAAIGPCDRIVELGAGSGEKLAILLAARRAVDAAPPPEVHLVDVSRSALDAAARAVAADAARIETHQSAFLPWLEEAAIPPGTRPPGRGRTLALFLGSNIGNFDASAADELLRRLRATLQPGDACLLGADLVKSEPDLQLAYDDPLGVTAAFNLNLLVRMNRELGTRIDIGSFQHRAVWNQAASRVEMHLVSTRDQHIRIPLADVELTLQVGDTIWTESSHKYRPDDLVRTLERCGFRRHTQWIDRQAGFALTLVVVPDA